MSQVIISLIHYFEFQVKFLGPLRQTKMEVKFFTSLWRSLLICLFVHTGLSSRKYVLCDYLTEIEVIFRYLKNKLGSSSTDRNRSEVLHLILEKVNKLNLCQQMVFWCRHIK